MHTAVIFSLVGGFVFLFVFSHVFNDETQVEERQGVLQSFAFAEGQEKGRSGKIKVTFLELKIEEGRLARCYVRGFDALFLEGDTLLFSYVLTGGSIKDENKKLYLEAMIHSVVPKEQFSAADFQGS